MIEDLESLPEWVISFAEANRGKGAGRGLPVGVQERVLASGRRRYIATLGSPAGPIHLGTFDDPLAAGVAYFQAKAPRFDALTGKLEAIRPGLTDALVEDWLDCWLESAGIDIHKLMELLGMEQGAAQAGGGELDR